jgi:hypothetical protein
VLTFAFATGVTDVNGSRLKGDDGQDGEKAGLFSTLEKKAEFPPGGEKAGFTPGVEEIG